jgi:hypothetical protein
MRYLGIAAFGATVCIVTPLITPSAGPVERAKLFAPDSTDLTVDGTPIRVTLDKPFVDSGDKVHLTMTADKEVQVGIVVIGSSGNEGDRVPDPPRPVAHETVTLVPDKSGHATKTVAITLHNAKTSGYQPYGSYKLYVMSREGGERLEKLVDRAGPSIPTGEIPDMDTDTEKLFGVLANLGKYDEGDHSKDATLFGNGQVAMLEAFTRPYQTEVAIKAPDKVKRNAPFTVSVTIENPHGHALKDVTVSLDTMAIGNEKYLGIQAGPTIGKPVSFETLRAHEKKTVQITVTSPEIGILGLRAKAQCDDYCDRDDDRLRRGTFEAVEIVEADHTPVAKR